MSIEDKDEFIHRLEPHVSHGLRELFDVYETLRNDANAAWVSLQQDYGNQTLRRSAVRCTFAEIEGVLFGMKRLALAWLSRTEVPTKLSHSRSAEVGRLGLLREEAYDLDDHGRVKIRQARIDLMRNVLFTFRTWETIFDQKVGISRSSEQWKRLVRSIAVRNRITHPKAAVDVVVADGELHDVNRSYNDFSEWFRTCFGMKGV
jgi:hypothetical protein